MSRKDLAAAKSMLGNTTRDQTHLWDRLFLALIFMVLSPVFLAWALLRLA